MLAFVRKNLDLLQTALDTMSEKILVMDEAGHIVLANAGWRTLFPSERRGKSSLGPGETLRSLDILNAKDEDTADFLAGLDRLATGSAAALTRIGRSSAADGTVDARWYRLHAAHLHFGRWTGVVVTLDDVSDAQLAKQAVNRLSLRLNRLQEQERERIALELHDSTAQHLAAASLNLAALRTRITLTGRNAVLLEDIERSLQTALREVQVTSFALYTPRLDEGGLNATLQRFVSTYERQTGIRTTLHVPALDGLPLKLQQTLLRIAQEALTNVHRHAAASHARVCIRLTRESVVLSVADDGRGMDRTSHADLSTSGTGIGISGMHARVDQLGGALRLRSRPGRGTRILAQIPLPAAAAETELRALLPSWLQASTGRRKRRNAPPIAKAS
jgi:signal transduction histidine kinase